MNSVQVRRSAAASHRDRDAFRCKPVNAVQVTLIGVISLIFACSNDTNTGSGEGSVVEIPDGVTPSESGLTILRNQWVIEHGNDEYTLIDLPEELQDHSEREVVRQEKSGTWQHLPLEADDKKISLAIENLPKGEKWLTDPGINEGYTRKFEQVDSRIIDAREHFWAEPGVTFNEDFVGEASSQDRTTISLDRIYPFVSLSCPEIGEALDNQVYKGIGAVSEDPTKVGFGPSRLVNREGTRGRCTLAFGDGAFEVSETLTVSTYYADYVVPDVEIDGDSSASAASAQSDFDRLDLEIDWEWQETAKILAHGDLKATRARGYTAFERQQLSPSGYSFVHELLAFGQISSETGPSEMPETTTFPVLDRDGPGEIASWITRQVIYDFGNDDPRVDSLMAGVHSPARLDPSSGTYKARIYAPPLGVRLNGVDFLKPDQFSRRGLQADDEIEIMLHPDSKDDPTHFEVNVAVRPPESEDDLGFGYTIVSTQPKFKVPPYPEIQTAQRGEAFVTSMRAVYCEEPQDFGTNRRCPSAAMVLRSIH